MPNESAEDYVIANLLVLTVIILVFDLIIKGAEFASIVYWMWLWIVILEFIFILYKEKSLADKRSQLPMRIEKRKAKSPSGLVRHSREVFRNHIQRKRLNF